MGWRRDHSTVVINNMLYCWGGNQEDLPEVHDNEEKRKITSSIDLFHLLTFTWERRSTTGTPPVGVKGYACTNIGITSFTMVVIANLMIAIIITYTNSTLSITTGGRLLTVLLIMYQ